MALVIPLAGCLHVLHSYLAFVLAFPLALVVAVVACMDLDLV